MVESRIRDKRLLARVVTPEVAAGIIEDGMVIATSGGMTSGYPKSFFRALGERGRSGAVKGLSLWSVCLFGPELEGVLAESGALQRRLGSHGDGTLRKAINSGRVQCNDVRTEVLPWAARTGVLGRVDVAVVDAVAITEEGHIVPSHMSVDIASYVEAAEMVIVEINHAVPVEIGQLHDIYLPALPPHTREIPIYQPGDRIGTPYITVDPAKIRYIVESRLPETQFPLAPIDNNSQRLAEHLLAFLREEVRAGRLPENLRPIECGIGSIADAVLRSFVHSEFENLEIFSGVIGDGVIELLASGKCRAASGCALMVSEPNWRELLENLDRYRHSLVLRPVELTNHPELLRRLGIIAINGAIEVDIYGNVNSSHIGGTNLANGVGGAGVFASNSFLSVMTLQSTGKKGDISTIVPMATHVDLSEHVVDVVVTEQGLADLRGLSSLERAERIIENCAHPEYRPLLRDYLERAKKLGGHQPHLLGEAFALYRQLKEKGSMKS